MMKTSFTDRDSGRDAELAITIRGGQDIFRFAINMLSMQTEFCQEGHRALVALRAALGPDRFDPMAKSLLGEQRYAELAYWFEPECTCDMGECSAHPAGQTVSA